MFARAGDNVVFVRGALGLQPVFSQLREGWPSRTGVHTGA